MKRITITEDFKTGPSDFPILEDRILEEVRQQDDTGDMAPFFFLTILGMVLVFLTLYKTEILRLLL